MYFPIELWKEIKEFAGIHSISTDWSFTHIYSGNWIQFYLEWFQPTADEVEKIRDVHHIQQEIFTRAFSLRHWSRVHALDRMHALYERERDRDQSRDLMPVFRNCNALLEIEPHEITEDYDMIECYISFYVDKENELVLLQAIHTLLDRCQITRLFYYYQPGSLILTIHV